MSGKATRVTPLQARKRLLIAESELNRVELLGDLSALTEDVRVLAFRARSYGSIASAAAVVVSGVAAFRRNRQAAIGGKPSRMQSLLKGAGFVSSLWLAFRSRRREREDL